ncbi:MAG: glycosyltransferase [Bacteroidales bacterium]|nr:glycosyltransferase [Clostridium sp.]MCM1202933.1 glycosyltransferase [Bacteroidales bacterium]
MRLQRMVWTVPQAVDVKLCYRKRDSQGKLLHKKEQQITKMRLGKGECVSFDTYFNAFSIGKWRKYTKCTRYFVAVQGQGSFRYQLYGAVMGENGMECRCMDEREILLEEGKSVILDIPDTECRLCYPVFAGLQDDGMLSCVEYHGENPEGARDIYLAMDICTFKREPYLKRNLDMLQSEIIQNQDSLLFDRMEIFVSDNAGTLGKEMDGYAHVHITPNENVGGVGGFTRGMLEAMEFKGREAFTHVLIMDDDVVIEPSALEKTYSLLANLKENYYNATIGGGLLRENTPDVQFESGASWNRGKIIANHHHRNLVSFAEVVANETEEKVEYTGWWYTAVPMEEIRKRGLPIPLFIHRDDIEYGLRVGAGNFILLNGIAVWHEAFENKMPGATEYYDLRNLAIVNCIHYPDYTGRELKRFLTKWVTANIVRYRYEYVAMNLKGIEDFLKGIDWLKEQDGQALHRQILKMNYRGKKAEEYIGYRGITAEDIRWERLEQVHDRAIGKAERIGKILSMNGYLFPAKGILVARPHNNLYDLFRIGEVLYVDAAGNAVLLKRDRKKAGECFRRLNRMLKRIDCLFDEAKDGYRNRYQELTDIKFWKKYLKMSEEKI